jgi:hypothetical protein
MSSAAGGLVTTAGWCRGGDKPRPCALALGGEGLSAELVLHYEILPLHGACPQQACSPAVD